MRLRPATLLVPALLCAAATAQSAIFPPDYGGIADGPYNSANLPLAYGTSRVQFVYDTVSMTVPVGHQITSLGFREDTQVTTINNGRALQLEVRIGYTTYTAANIPGTFDTNFAASPTTVFGPALFTLPNLRDPNAPLTNGRFDVPITPFTFSPPAGQNLLVEYRVFGTSLGGAPFTYYLDRADYVSPVVLGAPGCAHVAGTASINLTPTRPGEYFSCQLSTAPAVSPCVLAITVGEELVAPYPLTAVFPGIAAACTGQLSPLTLTTLGGTTTGSGTGGWSFYIPNNVVFSGLPIAAQGLFLDFFSPGGLVVSNGAQVTLGTNPRATAVYANAPPTTATNGGILRNYCPVTFFGHN